MFFSTIKELYRMTRWKTRKEFKDRVKYWADKIELNAKSVYLRPMRNKWASCSTRGNFNFNEELLKMDKKIGNYVIVHEMLHLVVPNHGKLWKSLMRTYIKNYESISRKLDKWRVDK
jgi:predicted metal-dependent hydrolase